MTTYPPSVALDGRYPIGKAAKALGVDRSTLLRATKSGLISCQVSVATNRKVYTGQEILRFWRMSY